MATKEQMRQLLLLIYNEDGPREGRGKVVPPEKFAEMTEEQVDRWDFERRWLMQRVAKAIAS